MCVCVEVLVIPFFLKRLSVYHFCVPYYKDHTILNCDSPYRHTPVHSLYSPSYRQDRFVSIERKKKMKANSLSLFALLTPALAQNNGPIGRAETALHVLQDWFNEGTGLWDTVGWWNGANCMTAITDLALAESHEGAMSEYVENTAMDVYNLTYSLAPNSNPHPFSPDSAPYWKHSPNWVDGSFDDDGWWALAWIAAYDLTRQQKYLNTAKDIFESLVCVTLWPCVPAAPEWVV